MDFVAVLRVEFLTLFLQTIIGNYQKLPEISSSNNNGDNIADATKTLKASSLINRGYERSEHPRLVVAVSVSTLTGSPFYSRCTPLGCYFV